MKHLHITIGDSSYDVEILGDPRQDEVLIKVNGETFIAHAEDVTTLIGCNACFCENY